MDFGTLLHAAQRNEHRAKKESVKCYRTTFEPPKKEQKSRTLSANIQKFLARKEEEEKRKEVEAKKKRDELLALRAQDSKAYKRVQAMLKRTKACNKSAIDDAIDDDNTAVTLNGPSQPDEDDYGYVSQEASAFYNKLMDKYQSAPPEEPLFPQKTSKPVYRDLNSTKDRVRMALLRVEEEEMLPHKRKRKTKEKIKADDDGDLTINYTSSDLGDIEGNERDRDRYRDEEDSKPVSKPKFKRPAPPPMDFHSLLKLAETKQFEPVKVEPKIREPKNEEPERLMTKKQKQEYLKEVEWRRKKEEAARGGVREVSGRDDSQQRIPKLSDRDRQQKGNDRRDDRSTLSSSQLRIPKLNDSSRRDERSNSPQQKLQSRDGFKIPQQRSNNRVDRSSELRQKLSKYEYNGRDERSNMLQQRIPKGSDVYRDEQPNWSQQRISKSDNGRDERSNISQQRILKGRDMREDRLNSSQQRFTKGGDDYKDDRLSSQQKNSKCDDYRDDPPSTQQRFTKIGDYRNERPNSLQQRVSRGSDYRDERPNSAHLRETRESDYRDERPNSVQQRVTKGFDYRDERPNLSQQRIQKGSDYGEEHLGLSQQRLSRGGNNGDDRSYLSQQRVPRSGDSRDDRLTSSQQRNPRAGDSRDDRPNSSQQRVQRGSDTRDDRSYSSQQKILKGDTREDRPSQQKFSKGGDPREDRSSSAQQRVTKLNGSNSNSFENTNQKLFDTKVTRGKNEDRGRMIKSNNTPPSASNQNSANRNSGEQRKSGNSNMSPYSKKLQEGFLLKLQERKEAEVRNHRLDSGSVRNRDEHTTSSKPASKLFGDGKDSPCLKGGKDFPSSKTVKGNEVNRGSVRVPPTRESLKKEGLSKDMSKLTNNTGQRLIPRPNPPGSRNQQQMSSSKDSRLGQVPSKNIMPRQFPPPDVKPRQFPPPDVKPRQFPPPDMRRKQFPPADVRRKNKPPVKRRIEDSDDYDSEMDDFIDDGPEEQEDYSSHIKEIFGYDRNRYSGIDDEDECMESNFAQQLKEEFVSTKLGIMEDLEDIKQEQIEKKKKALMKKRRLK